MIVEFVFSIGTRCTILALINDQLFYLPYTGLGPDSVLLVVVCDLLEEKVKVIAPVVFTLLLSLITGGEFMQGYGQNQVKSFASSPQCLQNELLKVISDTRMATS
uniref:Uncharacterized protein n=1 Tax=Cacopsylla melanoneura TaxID=428564 RepID=A0A8D8ZFQ4_9HEMI